MIIGIFLFQVLFKDVPDFRQAFDNSFWCVYTGIILWFNKE